ncbi:unnamed protein product [Urochloa decumbens]|uniref:F-box domain-containing protein n=1 Tax=Urochloa decumbens TaxID=240449 RepID=A0ABC9G396_9POAL
MGEACRRRHGPGAMDTDCISGLPDELLHDILLRLESVRAAARTSVLSRRWRHVWAHLPKLVFDGNDTNSGSAAPPPPPDLFLDSIDGALRAYSAPTLNELVISLPDGGPAIPARRVESWLGFASRHLVRSLNLYVPGWLSTRDWETEAEELVLPTCDRAQDISLYIRSRWRLRIRLAGAFTALTNLTIHGGIMEAHLLESLMCSQCPRLKDLSLRVTLVTESDISLRSNSLETLRFCVDDIRRCQVEIVAPKMEKLFVYKFYASKARISAPKLAKLVWKGNPDAFGSRIEFADASRHLRVLKVTEISSPLMQRFDKVDKLRLDCVNISKEIQAYESFVNDTNNLPKCETLLVYLNRNDHGFAPCMMHLLRKCNSVTNFTVEIYCVESSNKKKPYCPLSCPCRLPESCKAVDITLDSLEVVAIDLDEESCEVVEFVKQLSQCNATTLEKVVINCFNESVNERFCAKVRAACRPNIKVEFIVYGRDGRRVCL